MNINTARSLVAGIWTAGGAAIMSRSVKDLGFVALFIVFFVTLWVGIFLMHKLENAVRADERLKGNRLVE